MSKDHILLINVKNLAYSRTYKRISAISCTMVSRLQRSLCNLLTQHKCTNRNTASKRFCTGHNIRLYTVCLPCKIISGTSHSALDFIQNKENIFLITQCANALQKLSFRWINTAFSLYGLHNNCTCFICNLGFYPLKIIEISKFHTTHERLKRLTVMCISSDRKCSNRSAMERMIHGNDLMICMSVTFISILFRSL